MVTDFQSSQRTYQLVTEADMVADPACAAVKLGLVDVHSPEALRRVGAWRWPLLQKHREAILDKIREPIAIDFGGSAGPLGYGAVVVDHGSPHKALYDLPGEYDVIFSSHTLEHMVDLRLVLLCMAEKLNEKGCMIHHVPSWQTVRWRAENWPLHYWTFCLAGADAPENYVRLDVLMTALGLNVTLADDDMGSLLVIAERP